MRARREPLRIFTSARSAGVIDLDDRLDAVDLALVEVVDLLADLAHAGQHPQQLAERAHLAQGLHLGQEVLEGEVLAGQHLAGHLLGLFGVERLLGLLDEGEHVAHVEDPRGHAVGVEQLEVGELLAGGREHDRHAGDRDHGQRGAAAGVAVELGEHDAVEADALVEGLRGGHRVLADHRVDHEQRLVGLHGVADLAQLRHERLRRSRGGRPCRR